MNNKNKEDYIHYEIYEFDNDLKRYSSNAIGYAHARTRKEACESFQKENDWSSDSKILFAKPPVCR